MTELGDKNIEVVVCELFTLKRDKIQTLGDINEEGHQSNVDIQTIICHTERHLFSQQTRTLSV